MTINVRLTLQGLPALEGAMGAAQRRGIRLGLTEGSMRCLPILHRSARSAPPANPSGKGQGGAFNTGAYVRAWKAETFTHGTNEYAAQVINRMPYAAVIEHGRRPGRPVPVRALVPWVRRRLRVPQKDAERVAFVVARAIRRRGLRARRVMGRVMDLMERAVALSLARQIDRAVREAARGTRPQ